MFRRIATDQFDMDSRVLLLESMRKFAQKAGGDRGENAGSDPSFSPAPNDGGVSNSFLNMAKHALRSRQKSFAGACEPDAPTASLENGDAEMALEIANAAADRRFLNAEGDAGLAEAAMLDRRYKIAQVPKFNRRNLPAIRTTSAQGGGNNTPCAERCHFAFSIFVTVRRPLTLSASNFTLSPTFTTFSIAGSATTSTLVMPIRIQILDRPVLERHLVLA